MIAPEDLPRYTVKVYCPGKSSQGTGFWVGAGWVLTCSHVVRDVGSDLFLLGWDGAELGQATVVDRCETTDVALLEVAEAGAIAARLDNTPVQQGDRVSLYGYSDETPEGEPATFEVEGLTGQNFVKFKQGQVRPGMSGGPLLNLRTGRVCGMVKFTRDRSQALGGGAIPMAVILARLPQLRQAGSTALNPFGLVGTISDPQKFWNRKKLLKQIFEEIEKGCNQSLIGDSGVGKSSILKLVYLHWKEYLPHRNDINGSIHLDMRMVDDERDFFEMLCTEMEIEFSRGSQLYRKLRGRKYITCIENVKYLANRKIFKTDRVANQLSGLADGENEPLILITCSREPLHCFFPLTKDSYTSTFPSIFLQREIKPFNENEMRRFIAHKTSETGISFTEPQIRKIWRNSSGNPQKVQQESSKVYSQITEGDESNECNY